MFEIGSTLRDARVRRDLSLQQVEDETKIRVKYIQAMENEDFDVLPSGTYVKGFLRTYAEYLGIDYQLMLDEYNERYGSGEYREHMIQPPQTAKPRPPRRHQNYLYVAIIAVAIIAVLAYLGWGNSSSETPTLVTTTGMEPSTQTAPAVAATTPTQAPPTVSNTLDNITFTATSTDNWVELHEGSASGEPIWVGKLESGETKSLGRADIGAVDKLWLVVGSSTGLEVMVNGKPQKLSDKVGQVYQVTPAGMTQQ